MFVKAIKKLLRKIKVFIDFKKDRLLAHIKFGLSINFNKDLSHAFIHSLTNGVQIKKTNKERIVDASNWIINAQKIQKDNGVTASIFLNNYQNRNTLSYPEVTGYIIPTMLKVSDFTRDKLFLYSAIKMANFELKLQNSDGSFPGGILGAKGHYSKKRVFNSGQILHGLINIYKFTSAEKFLDAAIKAGDWIASVQEDNGSWGKYNFGNMQRTYDAKVSESLAELYLLTGIDKYRKSCEKNLNFILRNQLDNGWYNNADNNPYRNHEPLTHCIAYTTHGLIESSQFLNEEEYLNSAIIALDNFVEIIEKGKEVMGRYDRNWTPTINSICVTGTAQISICLQRLYQIGKNIKYRNASIKLNNQLKKWQYNVGSSMLHGGLPSTFPIWGDYGPYSLNSWGIKYYIDSLLLESEINYLKDKVKK